MKYVPVGTLSIVAMAAAFATAATLFSSNETSQSADLATESFSSSLFDPLRQSTKPVSSVSSGTAGSSVVSLNSTRRFPVPNADVSILITDGSSAGSSYLSDAIPTSAVTSGASWGNGSDRSGFGMSKSLAAKLASSSAVGAYSVASAGPASFPVNTDPFALTNAVGSNGSSDTRSLISRFARTAGAAAAAAQAQTGTGSTTPTATVQLAAVPLPAGVLLLGLGLGLMGLIRRKT